MMMMNKTKKGLCVVITATWLSLFALAPVATTAAAAVTSLRGPNESSDVNTVVDGKSEEASQQPRRDLMNYAHNNHGNYIQYTGNTYYPPLAHEPLRRPMNIYELPRTAAFYGSNRVARYPFGSHTIPNTKISHDKLLRF